MAKDPESNESTVDLSSADAPVIAGLTDEEQASFQAYWAERLKQTRNNERKDPIFITRQDLADLKLRLNNCKGGGVAQCKDSLDTFIEEQEKESYSTAELLPSIEGKEELKDKAQMLDETSYAYLFAGNDAIFKGEPPLSEDAKRNFATAFSLFLINNIKGTDISSIITFISNSATSGKSATPTEKSDSAGSFMEDLDKKLTILRSISSGIFIKGGDTNAILMNPAKGFVFLRDLDTSLSRKPAIEGKLKSATTTDHNKYTISEDEKELLTPISNKATEFLQAMPSRENATAIVAELQQNPETLEWMKTFLPEGKPGEFILKFICMFFGIKNFDTFIEDSYFKKIETGFGEFMKKHPKSSIFTGKTLPENFMKKDNNDPDKDFVKNIKLLADGKDMDEEFFAKLLASDGEIAQIMGEKQLPIFNNKGEVIYKNFADAVATLTKYREAKGKESQLTIANFIATEKAETETPVPAPSAPTPPATPVK